MRRITNKFKVGDRVMLATNGGYKGKCFYQGAIGTIMNMDGNCYGVLVKGVSFSLNFYEYELMPSKEEIVKRLLNKIDSCD